MKRITIILSDSSTIIGLITLRDNVTIANSDHCNCRKVKSGYILLDVVSVRHMICIHPIICSIMFANIPDKIPNASKHMLSEKQEKHKFSLIINQSCY
jgi:hypothetical protein